MANATLEKFGYPASLVRDYEHWCVLVRPAQATLGALVLGAKSDAHALAALPPEAFLELATISRHIEAGLTAFRPFEKLNYLMLMMVDPHVHFHVLPRYGAARVWRALTFADPGWPGPPNLGAGHKLGADELAALTGEIAARWPRA